MGKLEGKVAIVTGSGGGIGRAVAQAFAREGAKVIVNGRTAANVEESVKLIRSERGQAIGVPGDVSEQGVAETIVKAGVDRWGAVDVLVNNAAIAGPVAPLGKEDVAEWWKTQQVNILGPFLMTRAAVAAMRKKPFTPGGPPRGKVIDVSSGAGRGFAGDLVPYRVSKAGLLRLSTALAAHLQPEGIEVNTVDVFATTPMVLAMGRMDDQDPVLAARMRKRAASQEPTPDDNTPVFVWLGSSRSDGVSGRNFGWNMNVEDLDRVKPRLMADTRALRIEMVPMEGIGLSPQARAYQDHVAAMQKRG